MTTTLSRRSAIAALASTAAATATVTAATAAAIPAISANPDAGAFARMKVTIDYLRTGYVCDGWKLDEDRAARVLRYFKHGGDEAEEQQR